METSNNSARALLRISQVAGERTSGTPLTKATVRVGQVIIIGQQPILEATLPSAPALILYGRPGASFSIESTSDLGSPNSWTLFRRVPQTDPFQLIGNLASGGGAIFY